MQHPSFDSAVVDVTATRLFRLTGLYEYLTRATAHTINTTTLVQLLMPQCHCL